MESYPVFECSSSTVEVLVHCNVDRQWKVEESGFFPPHTNTDGWTNNEDTSKSTSNGNG
jgi:hypothetical protein